MKLYGCLASFMVIVALLISIPSTAYAIERREVLERGKSWVTAGVMYSQSSYYKGYRQDCSGFVSMAWKLNTSRTTSTFDPVTKEIRKKDLRPGDAVLRRGQHVILFVKWKDKEDGTYHCYEESQSGKPALSRVKQLKGNETFIRYDKIEEDPDPNYITPPDCVLLVTNQPPVLPNLTELLLNPMLSLPLVEIEETAPTVLACQVTR